MYIQPGRLKWQAFSPSHFRWDSVEVFYAGKEVGWCLADNGVVSGDRFFTRNDAIRDAEYVYALPAVQS